MMKNTEMSYIRTGMSVYVMYHPTLLTIVVTFLNENMNMGVIATQIVLSEYHSMTFSI